MPEPDSHQPAKCEASHTVHGEIRTKRQYIIDFKRNNPDSTAKEIAEKIKTSPSYVYNVLSRQKNQVTSEPRGSGGLNPRNPVVSAHGLRFYRDCVPSAWYGLLQAPVVNSRTGMKQLGLRDCGDPCSIQIHRSGRVLVYPHSLEWRSWLAEQVVSHGWGQDQADLLLSGLNHIVVVAEGGTKVPEGFLPNNFILRTVWGFVAVRDDTPSKNTLEIKLSVPDLERYLGLPELRTQVELAAQGTFNNARLLRAAVGILIKVHEQLQKLSATEKTRQPGSASGP